MLELSLHLSQSSHLGYIAHNATSSLLCQASRCSYGSVDGYYDCNSGSALANLNILPRKVQNCRKTPAKLGNEYIKEL